MLVFMDPLDRSGCHDFVTWTVSGWETPRDHPTSEPNVQTSIPANRHDAASASSALGNTSSGLDFVISTDDPR
jgi:hypothetical protein